MLKNIPYEGSRRQALHILDRRLRQFRAIDINDRPEDGWLHVIRTTIRMPQRDLADRLGVTEQAIKQMEKREAAFTISLGLMQKAADAMGLDFVYGFIPRAESLEILVEAQIHKFIERWHHTLGTDKWLRFRTDQLLEKPKSDIWEIKVHLPPSLRPEANDPDDSDPEDNDHETNPPKSKAPAFPIPRPRRSRPLPPPPWLPDPTDPPEPPWAPGEY